LASQWLGASQVLLSAVGVLETEGEQVSGADQLREHVKELKQSFHGFDLVEIEESIQQAAHGELQSHEEVFASIRGQR